MVPAIRATPTKLYKGLEPTHRSVLLAFLAHLFIILNVQIELTSQKWHYTWYTMKFELLKKTKIRRFTTVLSILFMFYFRQITHFAPFYQQKDNFGSITRLNELRAICIMRMAFHARCTHVYFSSRLANINNTPLWSVFTINDSHKSSDVSFYSVCSRNHIISDSFWINWRQIYTVVAAANRAAFHNKYC